MLVSSSPNLHTRRK
jgi:hypothetical protein